MNRLSATLWVILAIVGIDAGACGVLPTRLQTATPSPMLMPTVSLPSTAPSVATHSTLTPTPVPTPMPANLVWFAPNMGSTDYADLFTMPQNWSVARAKINVFKFYTQNLLDDPCDICGKNTLQTFIRADAFRKLNEWNLATAIEVGAVKEWGCTGEQEFRVADTVIRNVQLNGGTVGLLAMDEPLIGGQQVTSGHTCGLDPEQIANATEYFINHIQARYPGMVIGDIEPYPYYSVSELEQWITTLKTHGVTIAFFHLDVDLERVRVEKHDVSADLRTLSTFCKQRGIPFGVIFTSNWQAAGSNHAYYDSTMQWIHTVNDAIGAPQHMIFQSWQGPAPSGAHEIPINLPQNDPENYSHVRIINDGLTVFGR